MELASLVLSPLRSGTVFPQHSCGASIARILPLRSGLATRLHCSTAELWSSLRSHFPRSARARHTAPPQHSCGAHFVRILPAPLGLATGRFRSRAAGSQARTNGVPQQSCGLTAFAASARRTSGAVEHRRVLKKWERGGASHPPTLGIYAICAFEAQIEGVLDLLRLLAPVLFPSSFPLSLGCI